MSEEFPIPTEMAERIAALEERVSRLESLLTPAQNAELRLIKQAEDVVDVAKAEGQL